jgi:hypothetical protein
MTDAPSSSHLLPPTPLAAARREVMPPTSCADSSPRAHVDPWLAVQHMSHGGCPYRSSALPPVALLWFHTCYAYLQCVAHAWCWKRHVPTTTLAFVSSSPYDIEISLAFAVAVAAIALEQRQSSPTASSSPLTDVTSAARGKLRRSHRLRRAQRGSDVSI